MVLTFSDTHNMITYLTKSDASEGFDQIIYFLNASSIKYALIVNLNIYVSCIKQFWSSVSVKKVNDVTRLQALVGRKKVVITEATIRDALRLGDAESIDCLPNEEIFTELSRMGYEKPSTKLTFYKAFFSPQWKFLIHTILQCMSAKRTSWNEFSSFIASAIICLSTVGDLSSHSTKYSSLALTQKVFANMRRVRKGFSGVDTPLFEGMIVAQQNDDVAYEGVASVDVDVVPAAVDEPSKPSPTPTTQPPPPSQDLPSTSQVLPTPPPSPIAQPPSPQQQPQPSQPSHDAEISMDLLHTLLETCTTLTKRVKHLEQDKIAQTLEITKLKHKVKKLERRNKLKISKLRRLKWVGTAQRVDTSEDTVMDDLTASATITAADTSVTAAVINAAPSAARRRKGVKQAQIEQDEAYARELEAELNKNINWDEVIEQVQRKEKEDNDVMRNMAGFKMDYFKGMSYDDIRPIFKKYFNSNVAFLDKTKEQLEEEESRALKRKTESQAEKAAKKQKLDEEVEELKHLQIVPNDDDNDDDVYTEATPFACKVPGVDYKIYKENNKPYYKIIRADGSPQLFLSFLSLLRNFDREDLKVLWQLVKEIFASSKPKNFLDDFLLTTLSYMFEKPDVQA
uniref:Synaptobrevin, longin-like domain protein n=1 Tax=Tanacetum cinerariifolium TaxID=118510 RepID=A0A6L2NZV3_TANCI|nr:hypothetical protein [Tanacetum cinerariifolium]